MYFVARTFQSLGVALILWNSFLWRILARGLIKQEGVEFKNIFIQFYVAYVAYS